MRKYKVELVEKEPPYICLGYVKNTSIKDGKLEFARSERDALIISDRQTMAAVLNLIAEHNSNPKYVRVMDWITEVGSDKRVFAREIYW